MNIDRHKLAEAGFAYFEPGDKIKCQECNLTLNTRNHGDDLFSTHKNFSPTCPFVNRRSHSQLDEFDFDNRGLPMTENSDSFPHNQVRTGQHSFNQMDTSGQGSFTSIHGKPVCQPSDDNGGADNIPPNPLNRLPEGHSWHGITDRPTRPHLIEDQSYSLGNTGGNTSFSNLTREMHDMHIDQEQRTGTGVSPQFRTHDSMHQMQSQIGTESRVPNPTFNSSQGVQQQGTIQPISLSMPAPVRITNNEQATQIMRDTNHRQNEWLNPRPQPVQPIDYTVKSKRLESFVGKWPPNHFIKPEELAEAGLYYTGPGDRCQCAWCKGGLLNWEVGDTALGEHQRHFPECPFVRQKVASILSQRPFLGSQNFMQQDHSAYYNQGNNLLQMHNGTANRPHQSNSQPSSPNDPNAEYLQEQDSVKRMKEMGYGADVINKALHRLHSASM